MIMIIQIGEKILKASLVDKSSTRVLKEKLQNSPITIEMEDYASMEKVGDFGFDLPTNDKRITTEAGDLILYLGHMFVIYYRPNTWSFTKLGKIQGITKSELMKILGKGNVTVTLSLDE